MKSGIKYGTDFSLYTVNPHDRVVRMKNFKVSLVALCMIYTVACGLLSLLACTTTDKTAAASQQAVNTAADSYYEFYALATNAHPEKASAMLVGFKQVMSAQQGFSLADYNYKVMSASYKTNAALKGSVEAAFIGLAQNKSNLLWLVSYFKH